MRFEKIILVNPPSPVGYVANRDSMGGFGQLFGLYQLYFDLFAFDGCRQGGGIGAEDGKFGFGPFSFLF